MKVIALTGRERVGKGTVAEFIIDALRSVDGCYAITEGFADRLKVSAALALGFEANDDAGLIEAMDALKVCGTIEASAQHGPNDEQFSELTGREFLQRYGTESHRDVFGEDFWIDAVLPPTLDRNDCDVLVIHDLRFPNEAERVHAYGGEVWQVVRPGFTNAPGSHASQQGVEGDLVIDNRHGLDYLRGAVCLALEPTTADLQERQQTLGVHP